MYEFVTKKEYSPIRAEVEQIIKSVQKMLKQENKNLTFQFYLVGSGGKHLITRIKGGTTGYDFDYNLVLNSNFIWEANIRENFFDAFQQAIKGTRFNKISTSTSVITIASTSKAGKTNFVSCDFAIIYYLTEGANVGAYEYSRFNKQHQNYVWAIRNVSKSIDGKLDWLKKNHPGVWNEIKDEYLALKENNPQKKRSFVLYYESINNIYNRKKQK